MVTPVSRGVFEGLLEARMHARKVLRECEHAIIMAKARGVEPVTRENVNTDMTMGLGLRARLDRDERLIDATAACYRGDDAAMTIVIDALNAEAGYGKAK